MKEKRPDVFDSISLYNSVLQVMSEYSFRLTTRRFVQELFQDIKFTEVGGLAFLVLFVNNILIRVLESNVFTYKVQRRIS